MKNKAFTLIESMIVIFIIGMLTAIGAIGFGKVTSQKILQQATNRTSDSVKTNRDYSVFGKIISSQYPCGYGLALQQNAGQIKEVYTSGSGIDRVSAMENDKSCDELVDGAEVDLGVSSETDPANLTLGKAVVEGMHRIENGQVADAGDGPKCLVLLFSAPRGKAYSCTSSGDTCPPSKCTFEPFSEGQTADSNLLMVSMKLLEGNATDRSCLTLFPSGNSQVVSDVINCFSQ